MKRILAFFLSILLLSTLFCVPAYAVGEKLLARSEERRVGKECRG